MTQEIIEMAEQAGLHATLYFRKEQLRKFAKLVAEREREACAKVAFTYDSQPWSHSTASAHVADMVSISIGKAIRARGQA
jgi:hypothetical protein